MIKLKRHVPILKTMLEKHLSGYKVIGYIIKGKRENSNTEQMKFF